MPRFLVDRSRPAAFVAGSTALAAALCLSTPAALCLATSAAAASQAPTDPVADLLGGTGPTDSAPEPAAWEVSGSTRAPDRRLRRGCHRYHWRYAVSEPWGDWSLESTITDRRGRAVASDALVSPGDPTSGRRSYLLCRWGTVPGRFRIHARLTSYDGAESKVVRLPTSSFRLRHPARPRR